MVCIFVVCVLVGEMVVVWEIVFWGLDELMCVVIYVFNFWCGWC